MTVHSSYEQQATLKNFLGSLNKQKIRLSVVFLKIASKRIEYEDQI